MFRPGDDINQYIRDNYLDMTDEQMAIAVGTTAKAIKNRRQRLGLNKTARVNETPKVMYPKGLGTARPRTLKGESWFTYSSAWL